MDTDCVITSSTLKVSTGLGRWKLESTDLDLTILGPKSYGGILDNGEISLK